MKKLLLLFVFVIGFITADCQIIDKKFFNSASDTLTAGVTKSYVVRLEGKTPYALSTQLSVDSVSGDPNYSAYFQWSLNGIDYFNLDTATHTTGVDSSMNYQSLTHFPGTYFKVNVVATDTVQKGSLRGNIKTWYKY